MTPWTTETLRHNYVVIKGEFCPRRQGWPINQPVNTCRHPQITPGIDHPISYWLAWNYSSYAEPLPSQGPVLPGFDIPLGITVDTA